MTCAYMQQCCHAQSSQAVSQPALRGLAACLPAWLSLPGLYPVLYLSSSVSCCPGLSWAGLVLGWAGLGWAGPGWLGCPSLRVLASRPWPQGPGLSWSVGWTLFVWLFCSVGWALHPSIYLCSPSPPIHPSIHISRGERTYTATYRYRVVHMLRAGTDQVHRAGGSGQADRRAGRQGGRQAGR